MRTLIKENIMADAPHVSDIEFLDMLTRFQIMTASMVEVTGDPEVIAMWTRLCLAISVERRLRGHAMPSVNPSPCRDGTIPARVWEDWIKRANQGDYGQEVWG
jgi:hypothetical protein